MSDPPPNCERRTTSRFFSSQNETSGDGDKKVHPATSMRASAAAAAAATAVVARMAVRGGAASSATPPVGVTSAATVSSSSRAGAPLKSSAAAFLCTPSNARNGNAEAIVPRSVPPAAVASLEPPKIGDIDHDGPGEEASGKKIDEANHSRPLSRKRPATARPSSLLPSEKTGTKKKKKLNGSIPDDDGGTGGERTASFGAVWSGTLLVGPPVQEPVVPPHTLILGTHPSRTSLQRHQYYAFPTNAFWWIAGDCLGFRRAPGLTKRGTPYQFCSSLRYGPQRVLPYDDQLRVLCQSGFALWDLCQSCERPNSSLDQDIANEIPNPIQEFCRDHPSVRRIVLANGGVAAALFRRHFADWLKSGELVVEENDERSRQAFRAALTLRSGKAAGTMRRQIVLVCAIGVSGAAASYSYEEKRDYWEEHVYKPGLALLSQNSGIA